MSDARTVSRSRLAVTAEEARNIRARAWHFVFDCYAKKKALTGKEKAGGGDADEDVKKEKK